MPRDRRLLAERLVRQHPVNGGPLMLAEFVAMIRGSGLEAE